MDYEPGGPQAWQTSDLGSVSAYPTITGAIFESGFSDAILQMWAAYLDELEHGVDADATAVPLRDAGGGRRHAPAVHRRARVAAHRLRGSGLSRLSGRAWPRTWGTRSSPETACPA